MNTMAWIRVSGGLVAAVVVGCKGGASGGSGGNSVTTTAPPADLVPTSGSGGTCQSEAGAVLITVTNNAAVDAPATFTRVEFSPTQAMPWTIPTPRIKKGGTARLTVPMPKDCHGASCGVKISTDFTKAMSKTGGRNAECHG